MNTKFSLLLQDVGKNLALGELSLSDSYAMIGVENILVSVQFLEPAQQIMLYADVATIPENNKEDFYATLLEGQLFFKNTAGATLTICRNMNLVMLQIVQPFPELDTNMFLTLLENFVHVAQYWKEICEKFPLSQEESEANVEIQKEENTGINHFIRV